MALATFKISVATCGQWLLYWTGPYRILLSLQKVLDNKIESALGRTTQCRRKAVRAVSKYGFSFQLHHETRDLKHIPNVTETQFHRQ